MAQDVTVAGAAYTDVPAVALPATGGGTAEFYDVSATTATAEDVASGKTFYSASGALTTGTASGGGGGVDVFYGTCATAAATAAKAVVCEDFTSDHLVEGTVINAQTYNGAPTLNVNSTGAKNIKRIGTTNAARYEWQAGEVLQFVYDGTYWVLTDGGIATTTYYGVTKLSSATNSTSNALAATASAVKAAYDLANGKQDALVSGTSIKTVNGESLLGSGDLTVGGSTVAVTQTLTSGTEIASISVDGTATKLYAPDGGGSGGNDVRSWYSTCATDSSESIKRVLSIPGFSEDDLINGTCLTVRFNYNITSGVVRLRILFGSSLDADYSDLPVYYHGAITSSSNPLESRRPNNDITFLYWDNVWHYVTSSWPIVPYASSVLGGVVKVGDGLSIDSDGVLSATGSGGGGGNTIELYTNSNKSVLYTDSSLTTPLIDYYDWSVDTAVSALRAADSIKITMASGGVTETMFVTSIYAEPVEEDYDVYFFSKGTQRSIQITAE